jgi:hypothetical protein
MRIAFEVPIKAESVLNGSHGHWAVKAKKRDAQRSAVAYRWPREKLAALLVVTLTRIAPRELDDDNLRAALKSIRDGVATKLRVDDRSDLVRWEYRQERGEPRTYAVRVVVERVEGGA